jgi:hypothetical protein
MKTGRVISARFVRRQGDNFKRRARLVVAAADNQADDVFSVSFFKGVEGESISS